MGFARITSNLVPLFILGVCVAADDPPPPPLPEVPAEVIPPPADEKKLRADFMAKYTAAKPAERADSVDMLKGVREKESLQLLTGLLGDSIPTVRRNACRVMSETPDPEGYFIKFLIGATSDRNYAVRSAAIGALSAVKIKAQAFKALLFGLNQAVSEGEKQASLAQQISGAMAKLSGHAFGRTDDLKQLLKWWTEWNNDNFKQLEAADEAYLRKLKDGGRPALEEPKPDTIPPPPATKTDNEIKKTSEAKTEVKKTEPAKKDGKIEDE